MMNLLAVLLTVLFVGLKLVGIIAWSWWLVLLPLYGLVLGVVLLVLIFGTTTTRPSNRWR